MPTIDFGYNPPVGDRGVEKFDPATFIRDLDRVLDVARDHFSSFWVSDHLITGNGFRMECWTILTWLAARYPQQTLSTIVMANSYRHPPLLAKMAATLQQLCGGRFVLGYGAGWMDHEYRAYGYEFPSAKVRIEQMVEGIQIIKAMWAGGPASFEGKYYRIEDAICDPYPTPPPPILIGGDGERYLLRAVAEHGDWWLPFGRSPEILRQKIAVLKDHCTAVGRDYDEIRKTYTLKVYLGKTRADAELLVGGQPLRPDDPSFVGEPAALVEYLQEYTELGVDLFQLVFPQFPATDDMELFAKEVLPKFQ
jgi:alkanesulfonate monooxygenase SsuD/methylene tetrahydromethanopterin reductase-like flavin-dependent oxidoreductase (luciferase family)